MKNNEKVNVDNSKYNLMHDGSLMIRNSSDEDGGYYECMARNADGEVKSRPARMTVVHPEEVTQGYASCAFFQRDRNDDYVHRFAEIAGRA